MKLRIKYINRKHKNTTYKYPFLGYSFRDPKGTSQFKIIMNLSKMPEVAVNAVDRALRGKEQDSLPGSDQIQKAINERIYWGSINFGDVWCALRIAEDLGLCHELEKLPKKHRKLILDMIIDRVINPKPDSKLALYENFTDSALARIIGNDNQPLHEWYFALESIYDHQEAIQKDLFEHANMSTDRLFLYDITSAYFEGHCCPLACFGYDRDKKKGKPIIVIGLLTASNGRPIAIKVFPGNTNDQTTVMEQIRNLQNDFGVKEMIFVGDRGMVTSARRNDLKDKEFDMVNYISALPRKEILRFVEDQDHPLQLSLFDRQHLGEIEDDNLRYILCHNPDKLEEDRATRERLLNKTEEKLRSVFKNVQAGRYKKEKVIAKRIYRWLNHWHMEKFFEIDYKEGYFQFKRNDQKIQDYENLDGCYVIVTTIPQKDMPKDEVKDRYKSLKLVEEAFRSMKTADLFVRPIRHWNPKRVKGHVFVSMLSYLIRWQAWHLFTEFLDRQHNQDNRCEAGSLRGVWQKLHKITIGKISMNGQLFQQISPLTTLQKKILQAANANLGKKAKIRLGVVG